jgi:hypothetical protein
MACQTDSLLISQTSSVLFLHASVTYFTLSWLVLTVINTDGETYTQTVVEYVFPQTIVCSRERLWGPEKGLLNDGRGILERAF